MKISFRCRGLFLAAALLFSLLSALPAVAAQVKPLDDLQKTVFKDAITERSIRWLDSAARLQAALDALNSGDEISSVPQINKALGQLTQAGKLLERASTELRSLTGYVAANKDKLATADLEGFVPLAELDDASQRHYEEATKAFVAAFEGMAVYAKSNMAALRAGKKAELDQYDQNYRTYVTAADGLNEAYTSRSQFLERFAQDHPTLRSYVIK